MEDRITVEYYETFDQLAGICYRNENYKVPISFSVELADLEVWLNQKGLIGSITVDFCDSDGEPSNYESNVTLREYLCETFDEFVLSEYLNEHQDLILTS